MIYLGIRVNLILMIFEKIFHFKEAGLVDEAMCREIETGDMLLPTAEEKLQRWLHGTSPIAGLLVIQTGEKMSLYSAAKELFK